MAPRGCADLLALGIIVALSAIVIGLHVRVYTKTSPIDELSHIDTLIKTSRFEMVEGDERVGEDAMREEACRGIDRGDRIPPCDAQTLNPKRFRDYGVNVTSTRFPLYHFLTGVPARVMTSLPWVDSIVGPARLLGALWLAAGLCITWVLMKELAIALPARAAVLPLLATTPVVLHAHAIVNSDATLLFAGGAITYVALRWQHGTTPTWLPVVVAATAVVLEPSALLAVALCGLYALGSPLVITGRRGRRETPRSARESAALGASLVAVGAAVFVAVPALHSAVIGTADVVTEPVTPVEAAAQHQASEVTYGEVGVGRIASEIPGLVTPVKRPYIPPFLAGNSADRLVQITNWLLILVTVGTALRRWPGSRVAMLAVAALVIMLTAGPAHALWNARRDVFFAIPTRFGLPILPVLFAVLASALRRPAAVAAVGSLSGANVLYVLARLT